MPPDTRAQTPPDQPPAPSGPGAAPAHSLGHRAAHGFVWMLGQAVTEKVLIFFSQLVIAWCLAPEDFQLVALAYTVTTFASLFQQAGLREVLVQRQRAFRTWANAAFWMSLAMGLGMGAATAAVAPFAARFYEQPSLVGLLLVASITLPITALQTVPEARLRTDLRFRYLAAVATVAVVGTQGLTVVFALMKFGALSFILPQPIVALARVILMWCASPPRVRLRPQLSRWKYLFSDSAQVLIAGVANMTTYQGASMILGRMYPKEPFSGMFLFAWNLSDQATRLLVNNLASVLFPAFSTLQDEPKRQVAAYLRAVRALLIVGTPVCLLQAVLAGPAIRVVYSHILGTTKWEPAIPIMALLSVGMVSRFVIGPSESIFLSQGRFRTYMRICILNAAAFFGVVTLGAYELQARGAAAGVALCLILLGPVCVRLAVAPTGMGWRAVRQVYAAPVTAAVLAMIPAIVAVRFLPRTLAGDLSAIAIGGFGALAIHPPLIRLLAPEDWHDLSRRILALLGRARRERPVSTPASATAGF